MSKPTHIDAGNATHMGKYIGSSHQIDKTIHLALIESDSGGGFWCLQKDGNVYPAAKTKCHFKDVTELRMHSRSPSTPVFQAGDIVTCISTVNSTSRYTVGGNYEVERVRIDANNGEQQVFCKSCGGAYLFARRFTMKTASIRGASADILITDDIDDDDWLDDGLDATAPVNPSVWSINGDDPAPVTVDTRSEEEQTVYPRYKPDITF